MSDSPLEHAATLARVQLRNNDSETETLTRRLGNWHGIARERARCPKPTASV